MKTDPLTTSPEARQAAPEGGQVTGALGGAGVGADLAEGAAAGGTARALRGTGRRKGPSKGQQTRQTILDAALALAGTVGLEGLSIGAVAERTAMSKSGVFAHFGSREELQISVLKEYDRCFTDEIFQPALARARGLPRVRALFDNWMNRASVEIRSGCIFIGGAVEFDDQPGPVRDVLVRSVQAWLEALERAVGQAIEQGHFKPEAEPAQIVFEIHGLILALHYEARLLHKPGAIERARQGFADVLARYATSSAQAS